MAQNHSKCRLDDVESARLLYWAALLTPMLWSAATADTLAHATPSLDQRNAAEAQTTKEQKNSLSPEVQEQMRQAQCGCHRDTIASKIVLC